MCSDWHNLYKDGWQGEIVPEAFAHPAKYSRALIRHIYRHAIEEGWLVPGDTVLDPFGGVALGGLDACLNGLHWVGCELEPRFVDLGNKNIELWQAKYAGKLAKWGSATLLQGDSRTLTGVIAEAAISSPPYADGCAHMGGDDPNPEHIEGGEYHGVGIAGAITSPPYADCPMGGSQGGEGPNCMWRDGKPKNRDEINSRFLGEGYGSTPGQLGAMKAGDLDAAISSPPFGEAETRDRSSLQPGFVTDCMKRSYTQDNQGVQPGNLASLPYDGAVTSPPYLPKDDRRVAWGHDHEALQQKDIERGYTPITTFRGSYSNDPRNLGNPTGADQETFWTAARVIVDQVYIALRPGAHAIWVVKGFIREKQYVDFPDQWRRMCEAAGFKILHEHHAWLVEHKGTQLDLEGNGHTRTVERKSFFRRLAEKKGSPRIDYEVVLCMVKP